MEIRQLRAFLAVAEELHFAKAAERLGVSPPALTGQVQALEARLGTGLFRRTKRSVALTEAGRLLLPEARATLVQLERAEQVARRAGRGELGKIEVGYVASAAFSGLVSSLVATFRRRHADADIRLHEMDGDEQVTALRGGSIDIGFVRLPAVAPRDLVTLTVARESVLVALPDGHAAARLATVPPKSLAADSFIAPRSDEHRGFEHHTVAVGRLGGFPPLVRHRAHDLITTLALVGAGLGVAIVPESLRNVGIPGVAYRPITGYRQQSEVKAIYRRDERAPATRLFISALQPPGRP